MEQFFLSFEHQPFQLDQLHQNDGEKDARAERRELDRCKVKADDELGLTCLDKFFDCAESGSVDKPGDICRTDWSSTWKPDARYCNHDAASSSQGWHKDALLDVSTRKLVATEEDQEHLNYLEDSLSTRKLCRSRKLRKLGNRKQ